MFMYLCGRQQNSPGVLYRTLLHHSNTLLTPRAALRSGGCALQNLA